MPIKQLWHKVNWWLESTILLLYNVEILYYNTFHILLECMKTISSFQGIYSEEYLIDTFRNYRFRLKSHTKTHSF